MEEKEGKKQQQINTNE